MDNMGAGRSRVEDQGGEEVVKEGGEQEGEELESEEKDPKDEELELSENEETVTKNKPEDIAEAEDLQIVSVAEDEIVASGNEGEEDAQEKKSETTDKESQILEDNGDVKSNISVEAEEAEGDTGGEQKSLYERSSIARGIMDCGTCFTKYILCLFNFIVLICGVGVLFLGVWMYTDNDSLFSFARSLDESAVAELNEYLKDDMPTYIAYILMAVGGSMFVLSIIGYCGALRESRCLLGFYGFLLVVILILEITAVGLAFFYKDRADHEVRHYLKETLQNNYEYVARNDTQPNFKTILFDNIMKKMKCCGVDSYEDFNASESFKNSGLKAPKACCVFKDKDILVDPDCPRNPTDTNSYFNRGCYRAVMEEIKEHMNIVIYAILGLVCIELLSTFLAFCLCKSLEPYDK